jgi:hypothetical protein
MVTVINTPPSNNSGGPMGMIILLVVIGVLGYLLYAFGLPALRQMRSSETPQINVPSEIDVNINQTE